MQTLDAHPVWLYDGPMETRIEYGTELRLDPEMSIFTLVDSPQGRAALKALYRRDTQAALDNGLPIILNAPTYRASPAHAERLGYAVADLDRLNAAGLQLVAEAVADLDADRILVTAPVGPRFAFYQADREYTRAQAAAYHTPQMQALAASEVALISIAAMHGGVETVGAARAAAATGRPYTVGFGMTADGRMLDGQTPVWSLIAEIEAEVSPRPAFYVIGCTHPSVCEQVLAVDRPEFARLGGIKANGSALSPEELLASDHAQADPPEEFAERLVQLGRTRRWRVYGGCCGTDTELIGCLGRRLNQ